jgi:phthiodiolone/phenolphthiodiolone dimycocerosates ketoreductase
LASKVKFGLDLSVFTAPDTVRLGLLAEKLGYDSVWVADHLIDIEAAKVDPWTVLGAIGAQTSKVLLGSAVTDVQRTSPAKLAQIVATLDELTTGRAILGLGTGEAMNILPFGIPWTQPEARISMLNEAIKVIRLLWASNRLNPVSFEGNHFHLRDAWLDQKHASSPFPRIYVGALSSSKLLKLTGEIADGWLSYFNTPDLYEKKISIIREGIEASGRNLHDVDTVVYLGVVFSSDKQELENGIATMKVWLASERNTLQRLGVELPISKDDMYIHCIPSKAILEKALNASKIIPNDVAEQFMICGETAEEALRVIDNFVKAGARHFQLSMFTQNPEEMMRKFATMVLPFYV